MFRRIDIELTSTRPDGSWTWRAAGAKQPKGDVDSSLLPASAKVGDILRADIDMFLDGMSVTAILPPKGARTEPDRIEIVGTGRDAPLVTSTLVERKGRRDSGDRGDRRPRGDRPDRGGRSGGPGGDRGRGPRPGGDRPGGDRRPRGDRPEGGPSRPRRERPEVPAAPEPARLRAGRTHRNAVLAELPPEQAPIAEQLLKGGVPAVRQAIDKQNAAAKAEGQPEINADGLLAFAEQLLPRLRAAEWRDKAEAALAGIDELDLRDLRTVVVAADTAARDEPTKALAQQLRDGLTARVDSEHAKWLAELTGLVNEGRTVRALRLSSRPPKAGAPLPAELAERLAAAAGEGLSAEITQDRWGTMVDAIAFSPVRLSVQPVGVPKEVSDELKATMGRVGSRIPQIAEKLGITVEAAPRARPSGKGKRPAGGARPVPPPPPKPTAVAPAKAVEAPAEVDAPVSERASAAESPAPDTSTPEVAVTEAPANEAQPTQAPAAEAPATQAGSADASAAPEAEA